METLEVALPIVQPFLCMVRARFNGNFGVSLKGRMKMAIQKPRDLFLYDLRAIYDLEQKMAQMLPVMAQECMDNSAREAFVTHEAETRQHILRSEEHTSELQSHV